MTTWRWPILWLIAITLTAFIGVREIQTTAQSRVELEANAIAVSYGTMLGSSVRGLPEFLKTGYLSAITLEDLKRFRNIGEVYRFRFFNQAGHLILASEDLEKSENYLTSVNLQQYYLPLNRVLDNHVVSSGQADAELRTGLAGSGDPAQYSKAWVPLRFDGKIYGYLGAYVNQEMRLAAITREFAEIGSIGVLLSIGLVLLGIFNVKSIVKQRRSVEEHIRYLANHDTLSGALNRSSFDGSISAAIEEFRSSNASFAVYYIDLDDFKFVNDNFGHRAGDQVISEVAERLKPLLGPHERLARLGGDEFAILQLSLDTKTDISLFAEKVVSALSHPYDVAGTSTDCSASVGVATFDINTKSSETLMHHADLALYAAKRKGGNCYEVFTEDLLLRVEKRRELIADLKLAVEQRKLTLYYQPLYEATDKSLVGYEALIRWHDAKRGYVSPADFIPLAESEGLIGEIGRWVLHQACHDAVQWPEHISVAVNLSASQFGQNQLIKDVRSAIALAALAPERLELEITESLLMSDSEEVMKELHELDSLGIRVAMDDFGTGYSSLTYLWRFPFHKVKIDREFTMNMECDQKALLVVNSVVSLAHSLGMRVNAEGIETDHQMKLLCAAGCDELQGFFLGRPLPNEKLQHQPTKNTDNSAKKLVRQAAMARD